MGRHKPGKQRRARRDDVASARYSLRELSPPGAAYRDWYTPGGEPPPAAPLLPGQRVSSEARALLERIRRLAPAYDGALPRAALLLDVAVDTGAIVVQRPGEEPLAVPLGAIVADQPGQTAEGARRALHELHAAGAFLLTDAVLHGAPVIRFVAKRPAAPGDPWALAGDGPVAEPSLCLPAGMSRDLDAATVSAVVYLRSKRARLEDGDPVEYGEMTGIDVLDVEELFEAARESGLVDYAGCEACPAGHLCTRDRA